MNKTTEQKLIAEREKCKKLRNKNKEYLSKINELNKKIDDMNNFTGSYVKRLNEERKKTQEHNDILIDKDMRISDLEISIRVILGLK